MPRRHSSAKQIYHYRSPLKIALIAVASVILAALLLFIAVFFGFRKYAVYTDDGVTVEVPWLERDIDSGTVDDYL